MRIVVSTGIEELKMTGSNKTVYPPTLLIGRSIYKDESGWSTKKLSVCAEGG